MRPLGVIAVVCFVVAAFAAATYCPCARADFTFEAFKITANAPVDITVPAKEKLSRPMYVNAAGEWKPLQVATAGGGISFSVPADAVGSTVVILNKPDWLTLPDTDSPLIQAASIGTQAVQLTEDMNAGNLSQTPSNIMFTVADATNPIAADRVSVFINGKPPASYGGAVKVDQSRDGKHVDIIIAPGALPEDKHQVLLQVPDASPRRNLLTAQLTFSTAPLLRDGGFEALKDDGKPQYWSLGSWHSGDPTEYELTVAKGAGRTGNALKFVGIGGRLNMVVGQDVDLVPGRTYVFSGYYKNDCTGGYTSLIGKGVGGAKAQYTNTSSLPPAADWTAFSWEITAAEDNKNFIIYLRSTSKGTVFFDDVKLEMKQ